jgi:hypothetical protein
LLPGHSPAAPVCRRPSLRQTAAIAKQFTCARTCRI